VNFLTLSLDILLALWDWIFGLESKDGQEPNIDSMRKLAREADERAKSSNSKM
jgi:hypothetical protein